MRLRPDQPDSIQRLRSIPRIPPRAPDSNKGTYGRVLVLGGSIGMAGAPALVGLAALRSGAGLVTIAVPQSIQSTVATLCPCATTIGLPETITGQIDPGESLHLLTARGLLAREGGVRPDVLATGPGLGPDPQALGPKPQASSVSPPAASRNPQASPPKPQASSPQPDASYAAAVWTLINAFRNQAQVPAVIDADALNLACRADGASTANAWDAQPHYRTVITPHPGEMARLHRVSTTEVQSDREGFALRSARMMTARDADLDHQPTVVLKGAGTLVTDGQRLYTNRTGNPGMATGGSGDILSGIIAALIAQGLDPFSAAVIGVHVHGHAGDLAAQRQGQISLIATDLLDFLPAAFRRLSTKRK